MGLLDCYCCFVATIHVLFAPPDMFTTSNVIETQRISMIPLQVDAALIATGRAPFTQGLGLENVSQLESP